MSRIIVLILILLGSAIPVFAQEEEENPPDYQVRIPNFEYSEDETQVSITFAVYNRGGPATETATVEIVNLSNGEVIATGEIRPLRGGGDSQEASVSFPVTEFPPGSKPNLQVVVGVGEIEPADSPTVIDNYSVAIPLTIPEYEQVEPTATEETAPSQTAEGDSSTTVVVPFLNLEIDTDDPEQLAIVGGIALSVLLMLLILLLIVRLLFRRKPSFGNWQPPYANMPPLDPNSTYGRRQAWQQHAQNNVIPHPCKQGSVHARKMLLGMDGEYLSGWSIKAVRMTQYDMYGRVSRSQVLASRGSVRRLDRTAHKSNEMDLDRLGRSVRPVAKSLAKQFRKKINKRSAMLPVALDVRFQGGHGEVRIVFELYECQNGQPRKLDFWEPEMTVLGKAIYESYTFTVYGQSSGETFKSFRQRLQDDIERVLVDMLRPAVTPAMQPGPEPGSPTSTQPMQAVRSEHEPTGSQEPSP